MELISEVPMNLRLVALFIVGAIAGGQINRFIYSLSMAPRPIGPWARPHPDAPPRKLADRIPLLGWFLLRRESRVHGNGYWVRPLLIELIVAVGVTWLYQWETQTSAIVPAAAADQRLLHLQFVVHCLLFALLIVATFIDFDEQIIPDEITIPGTLTALALAALLPTARLPILASPSGAEAHAVEPLWLTAPLPWPAWLDRWPGLVCGVGIFVGWCIALLPWLIWMREGVARAIVFFVAHIRRPSRERRGTIDVQPRRPDRLVILTLAMAAIGPLPIMAIWLAGDDAWRSLLTALVGLAFGGGLVWAVRLVGSIALQREAMGFGDVTLMAMIGAFLGWQPSLLVFFLAPLSAVVIAVLQFAASGRHDIAFGPYLSLAAVIVVLDWNRIWNSWANLIFEMGWLIPNLVITCIALMGIMLYVWRLIRFTLFGADREAES